VPGEDEKMQAKDEFGQWIEQYQNLIFSVCLKMTGDYFAAEDLSQETFLAAYRSRKKFDGKNVKAWLCRIAANKCVDYKRCGARRFIPTQDETLELQAETQRAGPEDDCLQREAVRELEQCCRKLKPPYNEVARLYYCEERSASEIADIRHGNIKTIQTQIYRARAMLRKLYGT